MATGPGTPPCECTRDPAPPTRPLPGLPAGCGPTGACAPAAVQKRDSTRACVPERPRPRPRGASPCPCACPPAPGSARHMAARRCHKHGKMAALTPPARAASCRPRPLRPPRPQVGPVRPGPAPRRPPAGGGGSAEPRGGRAAGPGRGAPPLRTIIFRAVWRRAGPGRGSGALPRVTPSLRGAGRL